MPRSEGISIFPASSRKPGPQYCPQYTDQPGPNLPSLAIANPIIFPNIDTQAYRSEKRADSDQSYGSLRSLPSKSSPTTSYRPRGLSSAMLRSPNASDHLRRIHVTRVRYCRKRHGGEKFLIFNIFDSALHRVSNTLVLDHNGRHQVDRRDSDAPQESAGCSTVIWRPMSLLRWCLEKTTLRPGRFYVSNMPREEHFLSQAGFGDYETLDILNLSTDPAFSLDHLLVLAESLTSPSRFLHPSAIKSPDWYPISVWKSMQLVPKYIDNDEPLVGVAPDNVLLVKVLGNHSDNLRKYRNKVIHRQQSEDADQAVSEKRQREIEAELERSRREIEFQRLETDRLGRERDGLAQEQREMRAELEKLRRKMATDVYPHRR